MIRWRPSIVAVKAHVARICAKLDAEDRHQAALIGIALGLSSRTADP